MGHVRTIVRAARAASTSDSTADGSLRPSAQREPAESWAWTAPIQRTSSAGVVKRGWTICWLTSLRRVMAERRKPRILASDQDHPRELTFPAPRRGAAAVMYWKRKAGAMDL